MFLDACLLKEAALRKLHALYCEYDASEAAEARWTVPSLDGTGASTREHGEYVKVRRVKVEVVEEVVCWLGW